MNIGHRVNGGKYEYANVENWSKLRAPGGDLFALDEIFIPIDIGGLHWILAVIHIQQKIIQVYDSCGEPYRQYLKNLFQYLKDEHESKKGSPLPGAKEWRLVGTDKKETPQQHNGYNCGVFVCMFAYFLSLGRPLESRERLQPDSNHTTWPATNCPVAPAK
jgi:sentrin-specific protease 1